MNERQQIVDQVLDYWFSIEFLGQDSYEMTTDKRKCCDKVAKMKEDIRRRKEVKYKQITDFFVLSKESLYGQICKEAESLHMGTWGNITLYLGKIKRENCVKSLAAKMGIDIKDINRAEKCMDEIAIASLQLDDKGRYIPHTLSLSTIIWALDKINNMKETRISDALSEQEYQRDIEALENDFLGEEDGTESEEEPSAIVQDKIPVFEPNSVTMERLIKLFEYIQKKYLNKNLGYYKKSEPQDLEIYATKIQFFMNQESKEKNEDDNYLGLSHDYFSKDLKLVKRVLESGNVEDTEMWEALLKYISTPHEATEWSGVRHDLIHTDEPMKLQCELQEILSVENAPIGKWPSKYMPALMQQVAVNFVTCKKDTGIYEESGPVFSVNGPPGTGKTTLLKEIIANNIVERARLLAEIDNPDDAFTAHSFFHGGKDGNAYSKYYPKWYSLKKEYDQINDYGILVTSCNNTAVENITKELPIEQKVQKDLQPESEDSEDTKRRLKEISDLFSVKNARKKEHLFKNKVDKENDYKEIYFTGYAQELFGEDAWGLVTAPLGKKTNINSFYFDVLSPLLKDLYNNDQLEERKLRYKESQENFRKQLNKTMGLQKKLSELSQAALQVTKQEITTKNIVLRNEEKISIIQNQLDETFSEYRELQVTLERVEDELKASAQNVQKKYASEQEKKNYQKTLHNQILSIRNKIVSANNTICFFDKLLKNTKYYDVMALTDAYRSQLNTLEQELIQVTAELNQTVDELQKARFFLKNINQKKADTQADGLKLKKKQADLKEQIKRCRENIQIARESTQNAISVFERLKDQNKSFGQGDQCKVLDATFVESILSSDERISTKAQVSNPWFTEIYNREREKLLYEALQLNRDFVLSSKACRCNLHLLAMYWGLEQGEDHDRITFHPEDRRNMAAALYQTLFLLVPVISSTFASVGTLFRDVSEQGSLGMLVVDEAGQAQPQMAVGALFRARHAVIVGDPKQVEPVVTDDLQLLKNAYTESLYNAYKEKSLSVQKCADTLNPFGTYIENTADIPDWVGCPLLVHRRCISPMYEISNNISYNGIMKQQTTIPDKFCFIYEQSQWLNIVGSEKGNYDHYVKLQGEKVCEIVEKAFSLSNNPSLYIISPFTTVVKGIKYELSAYCKRNPMSAIAQNDNTDDWITDNIGTVHKFQGKEANEVIFLLGCDTSRESEHAVKWVNSNIVNVAVTRAKYRLYIVGDQKAWKSNSFVMMAKGFLDVLPLKKLKNLMDADIAGNEKEQKIQKVSLTLPPVTSFTSTIKDENGENLLEIETDSFVSNLNRENFLERELSKEQLKKFGFNAEEELRIFDLQIQENLKVGMRLYYLLLPVYELQEDLDASCCGILFCKALELQLRKTFAKGLRNRFPNYQIKKNKKSIALKDASDKEFMMGVIGHILRENASQLGHYLKMIGDSTKDEKWWLTFTEKIKRCADERNECCHPQKFEWYDLEQLIFDGFHESKEKNGKMGGVFFESSVGQKLN